MKKSSFVIFNLAIRSISRCTSTSAQFGSSSNTPSSIIHFVGIYSDSDKVASAYVDLYTKYAKPPLVGENIYHENDSCTLSYIVTEFYGVMSKDTILKVVKAYNKTSFDRRDVGYIKYFTEMESLKRKFSTSDYKEIENTVAESIELMTKRHYARGGK